MTRFEHAIEAVRCLQRLGAGASGAKGAAEIARLECLDPKTVVRVLERLRQEGFVRRVDDERYCLARETDQITLTVVDGLEITLTIQDLPPTYSDDMRRVLPIPKPKVIGPVKGPKGQIVRDPDTGRPVLEYDVEDPGYLEKKSDMETLALVYMVIHGTAPGELETECQPDPDDMVGYYRALLKEMKTFGFGLGQVTKIAQAVRRLSGITDADIERATRDFSGAAS